MMITAATPMPVFPSAAGPKPDPPADSFQKTVPLDEAARRLLRPAPEKPEQPTLGFKWQGVSSPPAVDSKGTLYLGVTGGGSPFEGVLESRTREGAVLWSVPTPGKCKDTPILHEGKLLVPLHDPFSVSTYDPATGALLATRKDAGGPLVAGKSGVFARTWRQEIVRVDGGWTFELKNTESLAQLKVAPDGELYASTRQGTLYALDPRSGRMLWSCQAPHGRFALDRDRLYVASPDRKSILELSHDGQVQRKLDGFQHANPCGVSPEGVLLVADQTDMFRSDLRAFGRGGDKLWSALVKDAGVGEVHYDAEGRALVPSGNSFNHGGQVECFSPTGQLLWRLGTGQGTRLAHGPDNTLYAQDSFYQLYALNDPAPQNPAPNAPPLVFNLDQAVVVGGVRVKKKRP